MSDFHNKNDGKTVILHCNTHLSNDFPSNIFFYEKTQDNDIIYSLPLVKSYNTDNLFGKLSNSDLLDFIDSQDLFDIENIQVLDVIQLDPSLQPGNTKSSITENLRNV